MHLPIMNQNDLLTEARVRHILSPDKSLYAVSQRLKAFEAGTNLMPSTIELQLTDACGHRCTYCSYGSRRLGNRAWSIESLNSVCDDIIAMEIEVAYFSGGGEPTLHKGLEEAARRLHGAGVLLALNTNGARHDVICKLALYFRYILVHIADSDASGYSRLMGAEQNRVRQLPASIRQISGASSTMIGARVVVVDGNAHRVASIADDLKSDGFQYANFTLVRDFEGVGLALSQLANESLQKAIEAHPLFSSGFAQIVGPATDPYQPARCCWALDLGLNCIISTSGSVHLCVPDIGDENTCIGNVRNEPLQTIWNGARRRRIMEQLDHRYRNGGCRNCRCIAYNPHIDRFMQAVSNVHREFI